MAARKRPAKKAGKITSVEPSVSIELDGVHYQLIFTFGAIREAKMRLRQAGIQINLLFSFSMGTIDADTLPELFFASLQTYHPELGFPEALALITSRNCPKIVDAVARAYEESMKDPEGEQVAADPQLESKD